MKLDLPIVFCYPLTPVPLSLAHVDGTFNKTDKSRLLRKLEEDFDSRPPDAIDVCVVDAMFFIRTLSSLPATFGGIAELILRKLCSMSNRIDFVCDTYHSPSIKDLERKNRRSSSTEFSITGPEQKRPKDFTGALLSGNFKTALFKFLAEQWSNECYKSVLFGHKLYLGIEDTCYLFQVENEKVLKSTVPELACKHEEADTRIIWHMKHACTYVNDPRISVRSSDTDVFIILLYHVRNLTTDGQVWMDVGLSANNTRRFIDISLLSSSLGSQLCCSLPALHAFSGSDYTASFMRKGKLKPLEIMRKSQTYLEAFGQLGNSEEMSDETTANIEAFVCAMYGKYNYQKVNEARCALFLQHNKPTNVNQPLEKIKSSDPSLLPPCKVVLAQKIKRCNYVAMVWKHADCAVPTNAEPCGNGWQLTHGEYNMLWYEGHQMPQSICTHLDQTILDMNDEAEPTYDSSSDESDIDDM